MFEAFQDALDLSAFEFFSDLTLHYVHTDKGYAKPTEEEAPFYALLEFDNDNEQREAKALETPVIARPVPAILELLSEDDFVCKDLSVSALTEALMGFQEKLISGNERKPLDRESFVKRYDRVEIGKTILQVYSEAIGEFNESRPRT